MKHHTRTHGKDRTERFFGYPVLISVITIKHALDWSRENDTFFHRISHCFGLKLKTTWSVASFDCLDTCGTTKYVEIGLRSSLFHPPSGTSKDKNLRLTRLVCRPNVLNIRGDWQIIVTTLEIDYSWFGSYHSSLRSHASANSWMRIASINIGWL